MDAEKVTTPTMVDTNLLNVERRTSLRRRTPSARVVNFVGSLSNRKRKLSSSQERSCHFEPLTPQNSDVRKSERLRDSTDERTQLCQNRRQELIALAVEAVTQKRLTITKASEVFKISKPILNNRISWNKSNVMNAKHGKQQWKLDGENLRKLCKLTSNKTDDEILNALKEGNVGVKEASKLIRILSKYLENIESAGKSAGKEKKIRRKKLPVKKKRERKEESAMAVKIEEIESEVEVEEAEEEVAEEEFEGFGSEDEMETNVGNDSDNDYLDSSTENVATLDATVKQLRRRPRRKKWTVFEMQQAVTAVQKDKISLRFAAKKYGIPKSSLRDCVCGKTIIGKKSGKKFLSDAEEQQLAGWLVMMHKIGWEVSKQDVMDTVKILCDKEGRKLRDNKDNKPRDDWWYGFLHRHKEVAGIRKVNLKSKFTNIDKTIDQEIEEIQMSQEIDNNMDKSCQNNYDNIHENDINTLGNEHLNRTILPISNNDINESETTPINADDINESDENDMLSISDQDVNEIETPVIATSENNIITNESTCKKFLTDEQEQQLAGWLVMMHKIGWGVSNQDVMDTVKILTDKEGWNLRDNNDIKPRSDWWYGFLRRYKEVADIRQVETGKFENIDTAMEQVGLEEIDDAVKSCYINDNETSPSNTDDLNETETSLINTDDLNENENSPINTDNLNENGTSPINTDHINENNMLPISNQDVYLTPNSTTSGNNIITNEGPYRTATMPLFKRGAACLVSCENGNDDNVNRDVTDESKSGLRKSLFKDYLNSLTPNGVAGDATVKLVKHVKQKGSRPRRKKWTVFDMQRAVATVKEDKVSLRFAAKKFGIPKSSLTDCVNGKTIIGKKSGKKFLTDEDETSLAGWLVMMHNVGKEVSRKEVVEVVKDMLDKQGRTIPKKNNRPGKDWWSGFLGRHKEVADLRTPNRRYGVTFLSEKEESNLTEWIVNMRNAGHEVSMQNVIETAKDILDKQGKIIPKKDNRPGRDWWNGFLSRHEEIADLRKRRNSKRKRAETSKTGNDKKSIPKGKTNVEKKKNLEREINKCLKKVQEAKKAGDITSGKSKKQKCEETESEEEDNNSEKDDNSEDGDNSEKDDNNEQDNHNEEDENSEEEVDNSDENDKSDEGDKSDEDDRSDEDDKSEEEEIDNNQVGSGEEEKDNNTKEEKDDAACAACGGSYIDSDSGDVWICCGVTDDEGTLIDGCGCWYHLACTDLSACNLTKKEIKVMTWHCLACTAVACIQHAVDV